MYNEDQVREATLDYFDGDELATNVFMTKYCLRDNKGNYVEKTHYQNNYLVYRTREFRLARRVCPIDKQV